MPQSTTAAPYVSASESPQANTGEERRSWSARAKNIRNRFGAWLNQLGLERRDFSILSNDCWAEALYKDWQVPYRTPFRGLGMAPESFLLFLGDLERYLGEPLIFLDRSRYEVVNRFQRRFGWPIGCIGGDVEIYFLHYSTQDQARRAWEEGCRSINLDCLAVEFTVDKDGALPEHMERFNRLPYARKLLLCKQPYPAFPCAVHASKFVANGALLFRRSLCDFDCAHWLNTGEIRRHTLRVLLNKLIYLRGV